MSYYRLCPHCGAALDPGERCDCEENTGRNRAEGREAASRQRGGKNPHARQEDTFTALLRNLGGYAR